MNLSYPKVIITMFNNSKFMEILEKTQVYIKRSK